MGLRGPKPTPSAIKKARGTYRPDRAASNEIEPTIGAPKMPAWLDKVARAEWRRVVPQLEETGVLTRVDGSTLEAYCSNYSAAVRLQQLADAEPLIDGLHGKKENPAASAARKHWQLVRQFAAELGFSPAARTRVGTPDTSKAGDAEEAAMFGAGPLRVVT